MDEILSSLGRIGIIPVVKIDNAAAAGELGRALLAGDLPVAEITFRTAAAEEAIRLLTKETPGILVGAGTVLSIEQAERAVAAGARFVVAPGFNPTVVDFCIGRGIPVIPGISSPTEIELALERGLEVVKVFPAGASGGLEFLKAIAGPFPSIRFVPTGGIDPGNLRDYLSYERVHAVGGTWIARDSAISAGRFAEITALAREAVAAALGFELAHVGINETSAERAAAQAESFARLFSLPVKDGKSSVFAGTCVEVMKSPYLGTHGHIAISTLSLPRAVAYLDRRGICVKRETANEKDGKMTAIYVDADVGGFAVHLVQR